ncbi:hypothetical protein B0A48_12923 [Cryoendolithus antarcticus]|uniref:Uncharacterized protein n=1 Tax=Cryoendolithus antarcticus TaxID=1507870 RepID=A0A1V8SQR2_9PEZI|nr:hypothetical protein B0A48_12923 [Cryoendolithus antarcticus]
MHRHVILRSRGRALVQRCSTTRRYAGTASLETEQILDFLEDEDKRLLEKAGHDADRMIETSHAVLEAVKSIPTEIRLANSAAVPPYTIFFRQERISAAERAAANTSAHIDNIKMHFRDQLREPRRSATGAADVANSLYSGGLDEDAEGDTQESKKIHRDAAAARAKDAAERYAQMVRGLTGVIARTGTADVSVERTANPFARTIPADASADGVPSKNGFKIRLGALGAADIARPTQHDSTGTGAITTPRVVDQTSTHKDDSDNQSGTTTTTTGSATDNTSASSITDTPVRKPKPSSSMLGLLNRLKERSGS